MCSLSNDDSATIKLQAGEGTGESGAGGRQLATSNRVMREGPIKEVTVELEPKEVEERSIKTLF